MERYTGRTIILSGGEPLGNIAAIEVPDHDFVIAADSGLRHAAVLGLRVDLVVGDMDSVDPDLLATAVEHGTAATRYPVDKDSTDLELALDAALAREPRSVVIIGAHTGRIDHLLGAIGLFAVTVPLVDELLWIDGTITITGSVPDRPVTVHGASGDRVSLIPSAGDAANIVTSGLRWNLHGEALAAGSTRGISNIITAAPATITVGGGMLLIIHERIAP